MALLTVFQSCSGLTFESLLVRKSVDVRYLIQNALSEESIDVLCLMRSGLSEKSVDILIPPVQSTFSHLCSGEFRYIDEVQRQEYRSIHVPSASSIFHGADLRRHRRFRCFGQLLPDLTCPKTSVKRHHSL